MTAEQDAAEVRLAYARLFNDNPRKGDAQIVLADMALRSGFYGVPSIAEWIKLTGSAAGYDINCHELNGKRALFQAVSMFAALTTGQVQELERIARYAPVED